MVVSLGQRSARNMLIGILSRALTTWFDIATGGSRRKKDVCSYEKISAHHYLGSRRVISYPEDRLRFHFLPTRCGSVLEVEPIYKDVLGVNCFASELWPSSGEAPDLKIWKDSILERKKR